MKHRKSISLIFLVFCFAQVVSQNLYDINFPNTVPERNQKCQKFNLAFKLKPKEVHFSIERENNDLYFQVNDKDWFNLLFKNNFDGLAIDVIFKDIYDCKLKTIEHGQIRGILLKPIYAQKLKKGLRPMGENMYRVHVGKLLDYYTTKELEFNILFLNNKNLCQYYAIYDLESYPWELLDMGMYLDSLTYSSKQIKPTNEESYILKNKTLKFKIPFEKNKSQYSKEDMKPIYDSLRLTDFNIKTIKIKAYSSIEGSLERNTELQVQRANSIALALQEFQKPTIKTEISSSENWVEFLNDIKGTDYDYFKNLDKKTIKEKLVGALSKELEPILKNHRKAVLELELKKKDKYINIEVNELLVKFNSAIADENLTEALEIQNSIFEKMNKKEISPEFLKKMSVPKQVKFVKIFNKNSAYRFLRNVQEIYNVYNELLELEKLAPNNAEVKYNLAALKIQLWFYETIIVNEREIKIKINSLKNYGIDNSLIARMMVNFHIVKAKNLMQKKDYKNKDKSVTYIKNNYSKFPLSDYDYLSLAQFFSYYGNTKISVILLENKARSIDINEDLLFYYLNLTIVDASLTQSSDYRIIMLNALNMNNERYCRLFDPFGQGGVTFQLLEDQYLRRTYCENCND